MVCHVDCASSCLADTLVSMINQQSKMGLDQQKHQQRPFETKHTLLATNKEALILVYWGHAQGDPGGVH